MFNIDPSVVVFQLAIGGEAVGGGTAGFLAGFAARKIWNAIKIVLAAFAGVQVFILAFLERKGLITVHWDAFGEFLAGFSAGEAGSVLGNIGMQVFGVLAGVLPAAAGGAIGGFAGWRYGG